MLALESMHRCPIVLFRQESRKSVWLFKIDLVSEDASASLEAHMVIKVKDIDPRVKRTRQLLQHAFLELLQEKGFQAITVQDITERATVNRATFYAHYEDKYALLDGYIREHFQQMVSSKVPTSSPLSVSSLRLLILEVFDYLTQVRGHECKPTNRQVDPLFEMTVQQELYELLLSWFKQTPSPDRKSTRLNSSHTVISYAVFCLKK